MAYGRCLNHGLCFVLRLMLALQLMSELRPMFGFGLCTAHVRPMHGPCTAHVRPMYGICMALMGLSAYSDTVRIVGQAEPVVAAVNKSASGTDCATYMR